MALWTTGKAHAARTIKVRTTARAASSNGAWENTELLRAPQTAPATTTGTRTRAAAAQRAVVAKLKRCIVLFSWSGRPVRGVDLKVGCVHIPSIEQQSEVMHPQLDAVHGKFNDFGSHWQYIGAVVHKSSGRLYCGKPHSPLDRHCELW